MAIITRQRFELLQGGGRPAGEDGFRLLGQAIEGVATAQVWLRRIDTWNRYLDPREPEGAWDVRLYIREDSAFALQQEFTLRDLDELGTRFSWPATPAGLAALKPNGDRVYDAVLAWTRRVTGVDVPPAPPAPEATAEAAEPA